MTAHPPSRRGVVRHVQQAAVVAREFAAEASLPEHEAESVAAVLRAMVVSVDAKPRDMSPGEAGGLGDSFTRNLLPQGTMPLTLAHLHAAIGALQGEHARSVRKVYAIAEGAAFQHSDPRIPLNARLVIT